MKRASLTSLFVVFVLTGTTAAQPALPDVIRSPQDYAGKTLKFSGATLGGTITKFEAGGTTFYYPTVQTSGGSRQAGFLVLPSGLAGKLTAKLDPRTNYQVNVTCKVEEITINKVQVWQGTVSKVEFVNPEGKVVETVKEGNSEEKK